MRLPRAPLVVDTSVLIAAVRGRNVQALKTAANRRQLLVTSTGVSDAARRIELGLKAPDRLPSLHATVALMNLVDAETTVIDRAALWLRDAVASQNGSAVDAHILACAWAFDADIWSFDRDFAGTGVASWSTANLMRALAVETA
ncbi:MAG: PIN domain-containing protein [Alphaproteobacteria bacterium]|nr:PIN domain-containing protein [Alphaproteobacteria bacterium]